MMPFEVSIIRRRRRRSRKKRWSYLCVSSDPTTFSVAFQWSNKWTAAGPLPAVAWGINEVAAHRSICDALLMKYKDTALLTLAPTRSRRAEEAALLLVCRCLVFNGDKVNFSICQSALRANIMCPPRHNCVSFLRAIHLNSFDAAGCHAGVKISSEVEN